MPCVGTQCHYNWAAVAMATNGKQRDAGAEQSCCNQQLLRPIRSLGAYMGCAGTAGALLLVLTRLQADLGIWPYPCWYMRPLLDLKP